MRVAVEHGYMRYTATPPLVLDLIRLIQLARTAVESLKNHLLRLTYSMKSDHRVSELDEN